MEIQQAHELDIPHWLELAAEGEGLFGSMAYNAEWSCTLHKHIERGTALCVREADGPPGAPLLGALLFSAAPPRYTMGWLSVAEKARDRGIGSSLVEHVARLAQPSSEFVVTTFGPDHQVIQRVRRFYERLGFCPAEPVPHGLEGKSRQIFWLVAHRAQ